MQIDILQASQNDLEAILQLQKDCYITEAAIYNDFSIQPLRQDLKSLENEFETSKILKAVIDGEIVGSVRGFVNDCWCAVRKRKYISANMAHARALPPYKNNNAEACELIRFCFFKNSASHVEIQMLVTQWQWAQMS